MIRFGCWVLAFGLLAGPAWAQMGASPDNADKLSFEALTAAPPREAPRPRYDARSLPPEHTRLVTRRHYRGVHAAQVRAGRTRGSVGAHAHSRTTSHAARRRH